jgi:hypothetical protein
LTHIANMTTLIKELEGEARKKYTNVTPAFAYVYSHNNQTGIRVEAPDIVKEFTDGVPLGRDPKGNLYFNNTQTDFKPEKPTEYSVSFPTRGQGVKTEIVLVIEFFRPGSANRPYAKFIALLPPRAHDDAKPVKGTTTGKWQPLDVTQATALAESESTSSLVQLTISSLKKTFTFNIPASLSDLDTSMQSWGYLILKDSRNLKTGRTYYVDYTDTRILIFEKQGDLNAVAVYGSYEIQTDSQPFEASFQVTDGQFHDL